MTKVFQNGDYEEYRSAVENKKAVLILCQTDKTSFGLLIVDPIILKCGQWSSSSLIAAFNILDRKEFRGKGKVEGPDWEGSGWVQIGDYEVMIRVNYKGCYDANSTSGGEILQITEDDDGINAITKKREESTVYFDKLEVYA